MATHGIPRHFGPRRPGQRNAGAQSLMLGLHLGTYGGQSPELSVGHGIVVGN